MRSVIRSIVRCIGVAVLSVVVALMTTWATLAIYYSNLPGELAGPALPVFLLSPRQPHSCSCRSGAARWSILWLFLRSLSPGG